MDYSVYTWLERESIIHLRSWPGNRLVECLNNTDVTIGLPSAGQRAALCAAHFVIYVVGTFLEAISLLAE